LIEKRFKALTFTGALVGGHWVFFFASIKLIHGSGNAGLPLKHHFIYRHTGAIADQ
jgi:hypothetical protein